MYADSNVARAALGLFAAPEIKVGLPSKGSFGTLEPFPGVPGFVLGRASR